MGYFWKRWWKNNILGSVAGRGRKIGREKPLERAGSGFLCFFWRRKKLWEEGKMKSWYHSPTKNKNRWERAAAAWPNKRIRPAAYIGAAPYWEENNNSAHLLNTCYVPGSVLSTLHELTHLILIITLRNWSQRKSGNRVWGGGQKTLLALWGLWLIWCHIQLGTSWALELWDSWSASVGNKSHALCKKKKLIKKKLLNEVC